MIERFPIKRTLMASIRAAHFEPVCTGVRPSFLRRAAFAWKKTSAGQRRGHCSSQYKHVLSCSGKPALQKGAGKDKRPRKIIGWRVLNNSKSNCKTVIEPPAARINAAPGARIHGGLHPRRPVEVGRCVWWGIGASPSNAQSSREAVRLRTTP